MECFQQADGSNRGGIKSHPCADPAGWQALSLQTTANPLHGRGTAGTKSPFQDQRAMCPSGFMFGGWGCPGPGWTVSPQPRIICRGCYGSMMPLGSQNDML